MDACMEYKTFAIYESNGVFTVGGPSNCNFNDCTLENLDTRRDESDLVKWCVRNDVTLRFYDFRSGNRCTLSEYWEHFREYDPDACFIVPVAIFDSIEAAKRFVDFLED